MAKKTYLRPTCQVSGGTEPGFTLNKLRHDDFHAICGLVDDVKIMRPDVDRHPPMFEPYSEWGIRDWRTGETVVLPDGKLGTITGFPVDADTDEVSHFARVDGRLYHLRSLKRIDVA